MVLPDVIPGSTVYHSTKESFGRLLEAALNGHRVFVAFGPLYKEDPASPLLAPFVSSARYTGWRVDSEEQLAPPHIIENARRLRSETARAEYEKLTGADHVLDEWARAGLLLEIATRRGISVIGKGMLHVPWRLNATVTGRFGAETLRGRTSDGSSWAFNPLTISEVDRHLLVPTGKDRKLAAIDFKAMDVCSMAAIVPGLAEILGGHPDPYQKIAELTGTGLTREKVKLSFLTWAYGGVVDPYVLDSLCYHLPEVHRFIQGLPHGEFPRMVQAASAIAFRAALSAALPLLVYDDVRPVIAVHDELVVDVSIDREHLVTEISQVMEASASARNGQPYRTSVRFGGSYAECKSA